MLPTIKNQLMLLWQKVKGIIAVPEVGATIYQAKVKSIMPYGTFVEYLPGKEGLLHISEISWQRVEDMEKQA